MFLFNKKNSINHVGTQNIETERFYLRKFCVDDADDVYSNWTSDIEAARYNAWNVHNSVAVTKAFLSEWSKNYQNQNYYHWAVVMKTTGEVIGSISASNLKERSLYCEIGYTVARKYWNQGIATEVLKRVIRFLVDEVGIINITAFHDVRNKASGRVMEKAGMVYVSRKKQFFLNSTNLIMDCCMYKLPVMKTS